MLLLKVVQILFFYSWHLHSLITQRKVLRLVYYVAHFNHTNKTITKHHTSYTACITQMSFYHTTIRYDIAKNYRLEVYLFHFWEATSVPRDDRIELSFLHKFIACCVIFVLYNVVEKSEFISLHFRSTSYFSGTVYTKRHLWLYLSVLLFKRYLRLS